MKTITPTLKPGLTPPLRRPSTKRRLHLELADGAAVIVFDRPDKSANVIDAAFLDELETALRAVSRYDVRGLVGSELGEELVRESDARTRPWSRFKPMQ